MQIKEKLRKFKNDANSITKRNLLIVLVILFFGVIFRFYYLNFGLPHSFYADEPEFAELAIKYTYEIKNIVREKEYFRLIPISFVYGTFPTYVYTVATMMFSKFNGLLGIAFEKADIYVFLRALNLFLSFSLVPAGALFYKKIFKDSFGALLTLFFLSLNWKFIVMSHYLNADIVMTTVLLFSFIFMYFYSEKNLDEKQSTLFTVLSAVFFGLALGTKVTAIITLPLFLYLFVAKKVYRSMFAFLFINFGIFALTNPFGLIFADMQAFRILEMFTKEAGLVFDSADSDPFKYIKALMLMVTPLVFVTNFYGMFSSVKRNFKPIHVLLIGHVVIYLSFYSLNARRVDRWLLPIIPVVSMYSAYGLVLLREKLPKRLFAVLLLIVFSTYMHFPILLLSQFSRNTPKSASYLWAKDNLEFGANKYVVTEEGLDPLNKLPSSTVKQFEVYTSEGAQFNVPPSPQGYHYIILSSRPMENFKRPEVVAEYPLYANRWQIFEDEILNPTKFELIKSFVLTKPNLIPLSDVYIYKNLNPITPFEDLNVEVEVK